MPSLFGACSPGRHEPRGLPRSPKPFWCWGLSSRANTGKTEHEQPHLVLQEDVSSCSLNRSPSEGRIVLKHQKKVCVFFSPHYHIHHTVMANFVNREKEISIIIRVTNFRLPHDLFSVVSLSETQSRPEVVNR